MPDNAEPSPPALGVENYDIGREISTGGMGSVMEARDSKLNRTVAIKVMLLDANADARMRARFIREAQVLALLAHPNIVPIYDIVWEDGLPLFYSMKLVKGRTLQAILNDLRKEQADAMRDFPLTRLLDIFRKVCDAIAFAHSKGVLHRDLKPENIMVGEFGEVMVMDWGLAKTIRQSDNATGREAEDHEVSLSPYLMVSSSSATLAGAVLGTPQYMSPEQARGSIDDVDQRSDIYALGGILYSILTLRPPVEGKTALEVLEKVGRGEITAPTALGTGSGSKSKAFDKAAVLEATLIKPLPHIRGGVVPSALSSVAMKALELDKQRRYPKVGDLIDDIEKWQGGFATNAEQAGLGKQVALLIRRHRTFFTTAAVAWALITALVVFFVANLRQEEKRALAGEAAALLEKENAQRALTGSALSLAEASLREKNGQMMRASLESVPEDRRDSTWRYLMNRSDTSAHTFAEADGRITGVDPHPKLPGVFACAYSNGKVCLVNAISGEVLRTLQAEAAGGADPFRVKVAFSKDGEWVAIGRTGSKGGIVIRRTADGTLVREWEAPTTHSLEFSEDGSRLLQAWTQEWGNCSFILWDVRTATRLWMQDFPNKISKVGLNGTFLPGGRSVYVSCDNDAQSTLLSMEDGTMTEMLGWGSTAPPAINKDGTRVLTSDQTGTLTGYDLKTRLPWFQTATHGERIDAIAFTPDERRFITVALMKDGRQMIELRDAANGSLKHAYLGGSRAISDVRVHPLSGDLFVGGVVSKVWSGKRPAWEMGTLYKRTGAFWGTDDLFVGPGSDGRTSLLKLTPQSFERLSVFTNLGQSSFSVSADARTALLASSISTTPYRLMRNPGREVEVIATHTTERTLHSIQLAPDGKHFTGRAGFAAGFFLFDPESGALQAELKMPKLIRTNDVTWIDNGSRVVTLLTMNAERGHPESAEWVAVWDVNTGKVLKKVPNPSPMNVVAVSPDRRRFAEAGTDKKIRIRDSLTLEILQEFRAHDDDIAALAWHPVLPMLASASLDLTIRIWDLDTETRLEVIPALDTRPAALSFSPSGKRLTCSDERFVRIWELVSETDPRVQPHAVTHFSSTPPQPVPPSPAPDVRPPASPQK